MTQIAKTHIATPNAMDLCGGFALFPSVGAFSAPTSSLLKGNIISINNQNLLLWSLTANASYNLVTGACGPSYAIKMDLNGTATNQNLTLNVSNDELAAGFYFGVNLIFNFSLTLKQYELNWVWAGWHSHFVSSWDTVANTNFSITIDPLKILFDFITAQLGDVVSFDPITNLNSPVTHLTSAWGLYDDQKGTFAANKGIMKVTPTFNLSIDISDFIEETQALNEALKCFLSSFTFGPQIGIAMPVTFQMKKVSLDATDYTKLTFFNDGTLTGQTTGTAPASPTKMSVELDHSPGFDLSLGIFVNLNLVKLWNIGYSISWPILGMLGIKTSVGTYANTLTGNIGSLTSQACGACGAEPTGLFDVIFEAPGGLAT